MARPICCVSKGSHKDKAQMGRLAWETSGWQTFLGEQGHGALRRCSRLSATFCACNSTCPHANLQFLEAEIELQVGSGPSISFLEVTALSSRRLYPCYKQTDGWDLWGKGLSTCDTGKTLTIPFFPPGWWGPRKRLWTSIATEITGMGAPVWLSH